MQYTGDLSDLCANWSLWLAGSCLFEKTKGAIAFDALLYSLCGLWTFVCNVGVMEDNVCGVM